MRTGSRLTFLSSQTKLSNVVYSDEELVERFSNVFSATPIVAQKKLGYDIPKDVCGDDIEKEVHA